MGFIKKILGKRGSEVVQNVIVFAAMAAIALLVLTSIRTSLTTGTTTATTEMTSNLTTITGW